MLLKTVIYGDIDADSDHIYKAMNNCLNNLLNIEVDGSFSLAINRFFYESNIDMDECAKYC